MDFLRAHRRATALQTAHDALKLDSRDDMMVASVATACDRLSASCRAAAAHVSPSDTTIHTSADASADAAEDFTTVWVAVVDSLPQTLASLAHSADATAAAQRDLPPFIWLAWAAASALAAPVAAGLVAATGSAISNSEGKEGHNAAADERGDKNVATTALHWEQIAVACARAASVLLRRAADDTTTDELQEAAAATCAAGRPQRFAMRLRAALKLWLRDAAIDPAATASVLLDGALATALAPTARRALESAAAGTPMAPAFLAGTVAIAATVDDCLTESLGAAAGGWAALAPQLAATCETLRRCAAQGVCA